jgi:hypothetical protein
LRACYLRVMPATPRTALFLFLLGCTGDKLTEQTDDTAADTDTTDTTQPASTWHCDDGSYTISDGIVETEHYRLYFETDEAEALQMARFAEAAFDAMAEYFDATPTDLPMEADWYADFTAFQAAIVADGTSAPSSGGYYWPGTKTAYMYTQPTIYFTRMLFLHELVHQFHYLARTENTGRDGWYVEGLAEVLSRHDWDGECLRLGRLPMLTWEDYPASALSEGQYSFEGTGDLSRPWAWATVRYLNAEQPADFDAFRDAYDADGSVLLADYVDIDETVAAVEAWVVGEQEPMTPVFLDWIHITDGVVAGTGPYLSMAVAKSEGDFAVSHDAPEGYAGVVAGYDDSSNYVAWLVGADGGLWTFVSTGGEALWWWMDDAPEGDRFDWSVSGSTVTVNGTDYTESSGFATHGGVALYDDTVIMEDIVLE